MEFLTMRLYIFHVHTLLPLMEVFFCFSKEYTYNNRRHFSVITAALVAEYLTGEGVTWVKQVYIFLFSNLQLWSIFFLNYLASMYDYYSNSYQFFLCNIVFIPRLLEGFSPSEINHPYPHPDKRKMLPLNKCLSLTYGRGCLLY